MKKLLFAIGLCVAVTSFSCHAFDLKSALKKGASQSSSNSSSLGTLIGGISNLLGVTDVTIADLQGTWDYAKPAVAFQSDNLLQKAGGAAAAAVVEDKLVPYYQKVGITSMKLVIDADSNFEMKLKRITLKGKLEKNADGNFVFNFQALGQVKIGQITSVISKTGNSIDVTFDASKLITLVTKVATLTGNGTLGTVSSLLNSYDGMNAGFQLNKE